MPSPQGMSWTSRPPESLKTPIYVALAADYRRVTLLSTRKTSNIAVIQFGPRGGDDDCGILCHRFNQFDRLPCRRRRFSTTNLSIHCCFLAFCHSKSSISRSRLSCTNSCTVFVVLFGLVDPFDTATASVSEKRLAFFNALTVWPSHTPLRSGDSLSLSHPNLHLRVSKCGQSRDIRLLKSESSFGYARASSLVMSSCRACSDSGAT